MMRGLYKLLVAFAMFAISTATYAQLSDEEMLELMSKAKSHYELSTIAEPRIFKLNKYYVLVDYETMRSSMNKTAQERAAKIKATRSIGEFLNGAKNKSLTVYDDENDRTTEKESRKKANHGMDDDLVESELSSSSSSYNSSFTTEKFSDKIIQEAKSKVERIQSLMKFKGPEGETVYCYFLMLSKSKAKKKY